MQRVIDFKFKDNKYLLLENGTAIFTIDSSDLKFDSAKFYEGVYNGKSPNIKLENTISETDKSGLYIFTWLQRIISEIGATLGTSLEQAPDEPGVDKESESRIIRLYALAACAGDGFFADSSVPYDDYITANQDADFALKISGESMEPTIKDGSIALVKKAEELQHKDIGIFVIDGDVMCKRYIKCGRGQKLVPDNAAGNFKTYSGKEISSCRLLGKVIETIFPEV